MSWLTGQKRLWLWGVIFVVLVGSIVYFPGFKIEETTYSQVYFIEQAALEPLLEEVKGTHLFSAIFSGALSRKLLSTFPQLADVSYRIGYKTLIVDLKEKQPWGSFFTTKGSLPVAADGTILRVNEQDHVAKMDNLFIIRGIQDDRLSGVQVSEHLMADIREANGHIKTVFPDRLFQLELVRPDLTEQYSQESDMILYMDDTMPILIGNHSHLYEKLRLLSTFLDHVNLSSSQVRQIDLRLEGQVIVDVRP